MAFSVQLLQSSCPTDIDPQPATCFSYANIYQDKAELYLTRISGISHWF